MAKIIVKTSIKFGQPAVKTEVTLYDGNDQKTTDANKGLVLRIQKEVRAKFKR